MTPTPLPPPDTHCFDEDTNMDVWSYSAPLVEQIVKQARADLEAEVARLRAQMQTIKDYAGNPEIVWKTAVAALEGTK